MFDFHERRKIRAWVFSWPTIGLLIVVSALLSVSVYERFLKEREVAERRAERTAELEELKARAAALEGQVQYLESERGMEEAIRDRYDAVKEGERVVIIMDESEHASSLGRGGVQKEESGQSAFSWLFFWR